MVCVPVYCSILAYSLSHGKGVDMVMELQLTFYENLRVHTKGKEDRLNRTQLAAEEVRTQCVSVVT